MRLIRTHMDYITAKINDVDSMIKKLFSSNPDYINVVQLLCTLPGAKHNSAVTSSPKLVLICLSPVPPNVYVVGLVLHQATTKPVIRRTLFGLYVPEFSSNPHWFNVPMQP